MPPTAWSGSPDQRHKTGGFLWAANTKGSWMLKDLWCPEKNRKKSLKQTIKTLKIPEIVCKLNHLVPDDVMTFLEHPPGAPFGHAWSLRGRAWRFELMSISVYHTTVYWCFPLFSSIPYQAYQRQITVYNSIILYCKLWCKMNLKHTQRSGPVLGARICNPAWSTAKRPMKRS